jgi:hypothetical protein
MGKKLTLDQVADELTMSKELCADSFRRAN